MANDAKIGWDLHHAVQQIPARRRARQQFGNVFGGKRRRPRDPFTSRRRAIPPPVRFN